MSAAACDANDPYGRVFVAILCGRARHGARRAFCLHAEIEDEIEALEKGQRHNCTRNQHANSTSSARNQHAISMQWRPPRKGSPAHLASHSQHRAPPWRRRRHRRSPPPYERAGCHRPRACEVWQGARLPARSRAWRPLAGRAADRIPGDPSMSAPMRSLGLCVSRRPCGLPHTPPDEDGHQRSSVGISDHQWSLVVISGLPHTPPRLRGTTRLPRQGEARAHRRAACRARIGSRIHLVRRPLAKLGQRSTQLQSKAIRGNERH